ncbi:Histone methylation protein, partial [Phytophthora palmivora]
DKRLMQLTAVYERHGSRISWSDGRRRMRCAKHSSAEVRMRLHSLKKTCGSVLADFPHASFPSALRHKVQEGAELLVLHKCLHGQRHEKLEQTQAVEILFASVGKADIRQKSGKRHLNAGEILPTGVTALIDAVGNFGVHDIFLDVGRDLGNVVAQVTLQTSASKCYGIEVCDEVLSCGLQLMEKTC